MKKIIAIVLTTVLIFESMLLPGVSVFAQEATTAPVIATEAIPEATPVATSVVAATVLPLATIEPSITPIATPTPIPLTEEEQDALDAAEEARDNEWETNEEDDAWVASHGGSQTYYTSGQWETDQQVITQQAAVEEQQVQQQLESAPAVTSDQCSTPTSSEDSQVAALNSTNDATSQNNDTATVTNNNCAAINNNSAVGGISGDNTITQNDGPIDLTTGNASANAQLENNGNVNVTDADYMGSVTSIAEESLAEENTAENLNTGEDSENFTQSNNSYSLTVENNNAAFVDNQMDVEGVSGSNEITENDGDIQLTTGDIELIANMLNILNLNITGDDFMHLIVNIFGQLNGTVDLDDIASALGYADDDALEVIARNDNAGGDSVNTAEVNNTQTTDIANNNTAVVNNEMNVSAVTGQNDVSLNDGGADVITGRIKVLANLMNFINSNFSGEKWSFIMVNIFGSLQGDLILPDTSQYLANDGSVTTANASGEEDSINTASASSIEETSVSNTNDITLTNNVNVNGVSGNNQQLGNDDGSGEHTASSGTTSVASELMNYLNFNITGNNWVFLIVNVFGKWMGQIVGFGDMAATGAPTDGTFAALSVGGEDSVNTAVANSTNETTVNNSNGAVVNNTINVEGISGENAVNQNDAGTKITTGWVEIDANLLNIINMNVTGRSWMIVFLNVFGDFTGNMFFGQDAYNTHLASQTSTQNESAAIGGASQQIASNSSSTNQTSNIISSQTTSDNQVTFIPATLGVKQNGKISVLSFSNDMVQEDETTVVSGVTFDLQQSEADESTESQGGILGFLTNLFNRLKNLFTEAYAYVKNIISPTSFVASAK